MAKVSAFTPELLRALADLGIDTNAVARVVIDIEAGKPVMLYVTQFGDRDVAQVVSALKHGEVEIVHAGEQGDQ